MPATFTKAERLSSFREIRNLMQDGRPLFHYPFKVLYRKAAPAQVSGPAPQPHALVISVPKRNFKRAVHRNLLKRRIRESYRLHKTRLDTPHVQMHLLLVYVAKQILEYKEIENKVADRLGKISEMVQQEH